MLRRRTQSSLVVTALTSGALTVSDTIIVGGGSDAYAFTMTATGLGARIRFGPGANQYFYGPDTITMRSEGAWHVEGTLGCQNLASVGNPSIGVSSSTTIVTFALSTATLNTLVKVVLGSSDASGTPGAATINQPSGRAAIAAAASSVVITNSLVTATSNIIITPLDADATLNTYKVVSASGSFTVTGNAAATAAWKFQFVVLN